MENKRFFVSIRSASEYWYTSTFLKDATYVIDPHDTELWKILTDNECSVCSGQTVVSDGEILNLVNHKYAFAMSNNCNLHILKNRVIYPVTSLDEGMVKVQHNVKYILWFGDIDGAINLKKAGVDVIAYVNDYNKLIEWDFVDGFWFGFNEEFKTYVKEL